MSANNPITPIPMDVHKDAIDGSSDAWSHLGEWPALAPEHLPAPVPAPRYTGPAIPVGPRHARRREFPKANVLLTVIGVLAVAASVVLIHLMGGAS